MSYKEFSVNILCPDESAIRKVEEILKNPAKDMEGLNKQVMTLAQLAVDTAKSCRNLRDAVLMLTEALNALNKK